MGPILAMLLPQFPLLRCQQFPVVTRVRLLHDSHEGRWLAFAYVLVHFTHLGQTAANAVQSALVELVGIA